MDQIQFWVVTTIGGLIIGIITFFLKRTISQLDAVLREVKMLNEQKASKAEVARLGGEISKIKEDFLTKEDFYRESQKWDRQLSRIMDILLELKGETKRGT